MQLPELSFPSFDYRLRNHGKITQIFDVVRRKYVALTPEEWVRQNLLHFLINYKKFPKSLIAVERKIKVNNLTKRFDVLVYNKHAKPLLMVECKAPDVAINQNSFEQIARYNMTAKVNYLVVTNGLETYFCMLNFEKNNYQFLNEIPEYEKL
jgi:hypothetical protein